MVVAGGRQLSMDGTSRVTGDSHARFCERLGVKFPGPTRRRPAMVVPTATVTFSLHRRPRIVYGGAVIRSLSAS
jgi:hypothetical protein